MALTYQNYAGRNTITESHQIAQNNGIKLYYLDEPINILNELNSNHYTELISRLVDETIRDLRVEGLGAKKLLDLDRDIYNRMYPRDRLSCRIYNKVRDRISAIEAKYYRPTNEDIKLIPRKITDQVDRLYISGPSGVGKSHFASDYALEYQREFPTCRVFLFSLKDFDPIFDNKVPDLIRVKLDRTLVSDVDDGIEQFRDSLMIFDDCERISDPHIKKAVFALKDSVFQLGRCHNIYSCSILHKSLSGAKSIVDLCESNILVCFPKMNLGECIKMLEKYCHCTKEQLDRIFDNDVKQERWLVIIRPNILITKRFIKIID